MVTNSKDFSPKKDVDLTRFPILLYDEECALCLRFKQGLESVAGNENINAVSLHHPDIYRKFPFLNKSQCQKEIHLLQGENATDVLQGGDALTFLISTFPSVAKFAWLVESGAGRKAVNFFYKTANLYRESLLNRCSGCKS